MMLMHFFLVYFVIESGDSCFASDGRAWKADGRTQALVGPGLATPLAALMVYRKHVPVATFGPSSKITR